MKDDRSTPTQLTGLRPFALAVFLLLGACSYDLPYNPAYLAAARRPVGAQAEGKALIYTTVAEDEYRYTGHPTSLTGSATTATIHVGRILREAAQAAFADEFRGGADASNSLDTARAYRVVVSPRPVQYSYQYAQLRNLGFAITPVAEMSVDVRVLDPDGKMVWQRSYASGEVTAPAYALNMKPEEEIARVTHQAAYDLMAKAAADVVREVVSGRPPMS
jgi:hypothetical protein